jgi:hypothetical protein
MTPSILQLRHMATWQLPSGTLSCLGRPLSRSVSPAPTKKEEKGRYLSQLSPGSQVSNTRKGGEPSRSRQRVGSWAALTSQTEAVLGAVATVVAAMVTGPQTTCSATAGVGVGEEDGPEGEDSTAENGSFDMSEENSTLHR